MSNGDGRATAERAPTRPKRLTARQAGVLEVILKSLKERNIAPTIREIAAAMRIKSTNGVNDHLRALERKGYIRRARCVSRGIQVRRGLDGAPLRGVILATEAAASCVLKERLRQRDEEGYDDAHDDQHTEGQLARAGAAYALAAGGSPLSEAHDLWPADWDKRCDKREALQDDPRRLLVMAAALLQAEIDRLDRLEAARAAKAASATSSEAEG